MIETQRRIMREYPLRYLWDGTNAKGERYDEFRHHDGRCVRAIGARIEMVGHEDGGSPYAVIEISGLEVNGMPATDAQWDELARDVRRELRGLDWG